MYVITLIILEERKRERERNFLKKEYIKIYYPFILYVYTYKLF